MASNDDFTKIPQDVIFQILKFLPTHALIQLKCVSKSFNSLISHPHFLKLHLSAAPAAAHHHLAYFESPDYRKSYFSFHADNTFSVCKTLETPITSVNGYFRLVGSSRGVLCLFDTNYHNSVGAAILWNPFIGKYKFLPFLKGVDSARTNYSNIVVGFGFDHRAFDFKVVKILYNYDKEVEFFPKAFVYAIRTGSWRHTGLSVPCFIPKSWCRSVFVNGVVHWLAYKKPLFYNVQPDCIMGFDLSEEGFTLMELPRNIRPNCKEIRISHSVDEKSVALFVCYYVAMGETWDLWLMNDYGKVESWMMKYTIVLEAAFYPLKIVNRGEVLAAVTDERLVLIDVEKDEVKDLGVCGLPPSFDAASYAPSLALLDVGEKLMHY